MDSPLEDARGVSWTPCMGTDGSCNLFGDHDPREELGMLVSDTISNGADGCLEYMEIWVESTDMPAVEGGAVDPSAEPRKNLSRISLLPTSVCDP